MRSFIYVILSEIVPSLKIKSFSQNDFIQRALQIIETLNYGLEFVFRIEVVCRSIYKINPKIWREKLQEAFKRTIKKFYEPNVIGIQRRLIDNAYKYDPEFAKSLINLLDTEESRIEYRKKKYLGGHFESLQLRKQIADDSGQNEKKSSLMFADTCRKLSASLNSNLIASKKTSQIRYLLDHAIKLPIVRSHPIYDYYIQNIIKRQEGSAEIASVINPLFDSIFTVCKVIEILVEKYKSNSVDEEIKIDLTKARKKIFKTGERDLAFKFIQDWLSSNTSSYIKICDPYFGKTELEMVKLILSISSDVQIQILTSYEADGNSEPGLSQIYSDHWNTISQQEPPDTKVSIVKLNKSGISPVHDRWILLDKVGLHLGTSVNGLGVSRISQISELNFEEKTAIEKDIFDDLFHGKKKVINGEKVDWLTFNLN